MGVGLDGFVKTFLNFLQAKVWHSVVLAIAGGVLVWGDPKYLEYFALAQTAQEHRSFAGLALLFGTLGVVVPTVKMLGEWAYHLLIVQIKNWRIQKRLGALTEDEKHVLRFYVERKVTHSPKQSRDTTLDTLVADEVLIEVQEPDVTGSVRQYRIAQAARKYLNKNPGLVEGQSTGTYFDDSWESFDRETKVKKPANKFYS